MFFFVFNKNLLIRYNTFYKTSQTVSQRLFDWSYQNQTSLKTLIHGIIYCCDEWLLERFLDLLKRLFTRIIRILNKSDRQEEDEIKSARVIRYIEFSIRLASFLNYAVFLYQGKYCHWWERLLRLRPVYKRPQLMRRFNHDVTIREELWHVYFSIFRGLNSFIGLKTLNKRWTFLKQEKKSVLSDSRACAICSKSEPTNVQRPVQTSDQVKCPHVFCYLCVAKELEYNSNSFKCPQCSVSIHKTELYLENKNL